MTRRGILFLVLIAGVWVESASSADGPIVIPDAIVIKRFAVHKKGNCLIVPVNVAGKARPFLVDTGSDVTLFDEMLLTRPHRDEVMFETPGGPGRVKRYPAPTADLDGIPLDLPFVLGSSLRAIAGAAGEPIDGVLGMDVLRRYIVHLDFDQGLLILLRSLPNCAGSPIPLQGEVGQRPRIEARLGPEAAGSFVIDTGYVGAVDGNIETAQAEIWRRDGVIRANGTTEAVTFLGRKEMRYFEGDQFTIAEYRVPNPAYLESTRGNSVGLNVLSRFLVTLDFPGRKLYLREGRDFHRVDGSDLSGLWFRSSEGKVVIDKTEPGSPAEQAGLRTGDIVLTVAGRTVEHSDLFGLNRGFPVPGPLEMMIRRDDQTRKIILTLTDPDAGQAPR